MTSRWKVKVVRDTTEHGVVFIEADTAEQAVQLAIEKFSNADISEFVTDHDARDASVTAVEAAGGTE